MVLKYMCLDQQHPIAKPAQTPNTQDCAAKTKNTKDGTTYKMMMMMAAIDILIMIMPFAPESSYIVQ